MRSSNHIAQSGAVLIDAEVLRKLTQLADGFAAKAVSALVRDEGLDPSQFKTAEDVRAEEQKDRDFRHYGLASAIDRARLFAWSVRLKSGHFISGVTTDQLLEMPNSGAGRLISLTLSNGGYSNSFEAEIDSERSRPLSIAVSGDPELVDELSWKTQDLFPSLRTWWWPARTPWVISVVGVFALLMAHWFYSTMEKGPGFGDMESPLSIYYIGAPLIFFLIANPLTEMGWSRVFPAAQFVWGGGKQRAAMLKGIRTAVLGAPCAILIYPYLSKLFGL